MSTYHVQKVHLCVGDQYLWISQFIVGLPDILQRGSTQRIEISLFLHEIAEALLGVHDENSL